MADAFAEYRIPQFKLVVATVAMFATGSNFILLFCLFALVKRGKSTAVAAGVAAGAAVVITFESGHWVIAWIHYKAVRLWFTAAFNPI